MDYDFDYGLEENLTSISNFIQENKPSAVVAINNLVARDIIQVSRNLNFKIPADLSLIIFDSDDISKYLGVNLTSLDQDLKKIGETASNLLIDKINKIGNYHKNIQQIYLPMKLNVGETCKHLT